MVSIASLWLPIVLASVATFILASLMWMVVGHHKKDYVKLKNEDPVLDALRAQGVGGGQYFFPGCDDNKQMSTPEFQAKYARGPSGFIYVRKPGPFSMGPALVQSIVFYLLTSTLVAYVATIGLRSGAASMDVFRCVFVTTWLAYAAGGTWASIWSAHAWPHTLRCMADCVVYAAATAALFAWRWPVA